MTYTINNLLTASLYCDNGFGNFSQSDITKSLRDKNFYQQLEKTEKEFPSILRQTSTAITSISFNGYTVKGSTIFIIVTFNSNETMSDSLIEDLSYVLNKYISNQQEYWHDFIVKTVVAKNSYLYDDDYEDYEDDDFSSYVDDKFFGLDFSCIPESVSRLDIEESFHRHSRLLNKRHSFGERSMRKQRDLTRKKNSSFKEKAKKSRVITVYEDVAIGNGVILEKGDKIRILKESLEEWEYIVDNAVEDIDSWMPAEDMDEFFSSDEDEQYDLIDSNIDNFFDTNLEPNEMDYVSDHRRNIISRIIDDLA